MKPIFSLQPSRRIPPLMLGLVALTTILFAPTRNTQAADPLNSGVYQLETQKNAVPDAVLFRQLQPKRFERFQAKTKALNSSLTLATDYLKTLKENDVPDLQRLSAYSQEAWLDWVVLKKTIEPDETAYQSYQLLAEMLTELKTMSDYWVTSEKLRSTYRPTLVDETEDWQVLKSKREKILTLMEKLNNLQQLKNDLNQMPLY